MSAEQDLANANVQIANLISEVTRFRDAAMGLNNIWPTTTEGRQNTADGKYFSVPGGGAYMRLYRRQGSSAELIAEFPDRVELNSVITQLGPLLGRGVVGGPGDLMARGAFGLGSKGYSLIDFDTKPTRNEFFQGWGASATGDIPSTTNYYPGFDLVRTSGSLVRGLRVLFNNREAYLKSWTDSNSEAPTTSKFFTNRNILGTVSQSGGVPTGAQFEYGKNANGEYLKLPDGTVFFRAVILCTYISTRYLQGIWTYPVACIARVTPQVVKIAINNPAALAGSNRGGEFDPLDANIRNSGTNTATIRLSHLPGVSSDIATEDAATVEVFGQGRWY